MTIALIYYFFSYFTVSAALSALAAPVVKMLAFRIGAIDIGSGRRIHKGAIPRLGGLGIFAAMTAPMLFFISRGEIGEPHLRILIVLSGAMIVFLLGVYDDIRGAGVVVKLAAETVAAVLVYELGIRITAVNNPFGGIIHLGYLSLPVTVLWILVFTNAFNLIDGLDGLAAGTGIMLSATFFLLSGTEFQVQMFYIILAGGLAGFLIYNFPPASIFMGDSGSLFTGFLFGAMSIASSHKATAAATLMIPIIAFSLPIMDMVFAVLRRYYRGQPLGRADGEHIHHKLLQKGLSKKRVLLILYALNIAVMTLVLALVRRQLNIDFIGLVVMVCLVVAGLKLLGYIEEFLPFIRELIKNHELSRRRKYLNYVLKHFRRRVEKCGSDEEMKAHISELLKEYGNCVATVGFSPDDQNETFFVYDGSGDESGKPQMEFSIPIVVNGNKAGEITLKKAVDDDYVIYIAELLETLSEELGGFAERRKPG